MAPHDDVWKQLLERKGLAVAASVLEDYGISCEADVSHLDAEDLGALSSQLMPLHRNLLRKWVEGLAPGGDRGTILSGTPAASDTSASSLTAPAVSSTHTASDKVESASRGKEKEKEREGEDSEDEDEGEEEEEEDEGNSGEEEDQEDGEEDVTVVGETSAQDSEEHGKRATSREGGEASEAPAAKKSKPSTLSTAEQAFVNQFKPPVAKIADKQRKISLRWVKGKQSTKKQGTRKSDVTPATLAKRPDEFPGQFLNSCPVLETDNELNVVKAVGFHPSPLADPAPLGDLLLAMAADL